MQCMIKSLALALRKPVEELVEILGHDGSEVIWPDNPPPTCYKGFHPQELIDITIKCGRRPTWIELNPSIQGTIDSFPTPIYEPHKARERWVSYVSPNSGVLIGTYSKGRHAWAKIGSIIKDPNLPDKEFKLNDFTIMGIKLEAFLLIF